MTAVSYDTWRRHTTVVSYDGPRCHITVWCHMTDPYSCDAHLRGSANRPKPSGAEDTGVGVISDKIRGEYTLQH